MKVDKEIVKKSINKLKPEKKAELQRKWVSSTVDLAPKNWRAVINSDRDTIPVQ